MIRAYDNQYLDDAMKCLGEAMDYAANCCQMDMDSFLELFIGNFLTKASGLGKRNNLLLDGCGELRLGDADGV